jgi:iron complex outermembrane recepter protein
MRVWKGSVAAVLAAMLVSSTLSAEQGASAGSIAGVVIARDGGTPIAGAAVRASSSAGQYAAVTDRSGRFHFDVIPTGRVTLTASAAGFTELQVPDVLVLSNAPASVTFSLPPLLNVLERVQVTASKTPETIGSLAAQASLVSREAIDARGDQTLPQAIAHVPGAVVSTQLGIFDSVMLRGLPRGDPEFTTTLLLVDGVPQTLSNNGARIAALPINDASGIEVIRGPNSALYGRTAIGGSVNVLTAAPTPRHEAGVDLTGGQFDALKTVVRASGPVKHWGGYYASVGRERNDGYFVNKTTNDFSVGTWATFAKLTFAPDARSFGSVSVNRVVSENSTPTNEPVVDGQLLHEIDPRFDRFTNFNIPGPNYRQGESRLTFNYTRELTPNLTAVEVFGYRDVSHHFIDDGDFIGSPYDLDAHTLVMYPFDQETRERIAYQEARLDWHSSSRLKQSAIGGLSYERNSGRLASDFIYTDPDLFGFPIDYLSPVIPPASEWQHDASTRSYHLGVTGLFARYTLEPTTRLVLTGGGRYDRLAMDATRPGSEVVRDTFDAFSPTASATFKALATSRSSVSLYGSFSQAFLPPRRPSALVPSDVPLNLKPEDITNYETGVKASLLDGRVGLEATSFRMIEDGVVLTTRKGAFFLPTNAGQQRYAGVETGLTLTPSPAFSTYVNASFYRNRFGAFVVQAVDGDDDVTGNRLPISPDYVVNWGASVHPFRTMEATFDVKHVGAVQTNRDNTFELGAFSVVDAALSWRGGPVRVTLSAHNLLNESYYSNSDGDTADPARPRQVLLTTSFRCRQR